MELFVASWLSEKIAISTAKGLVSHVTKTYGAETDYDMA